MSSSPQLPLQQTTLSENDLREVMVVELRNYDFPWTEGIFRDCIKAGYTMQALWLDQCLVGYGVMQVAAGEAHILNLCIDRGYNHRGYAKALLENLLTKAGRAGANMAFLEVRPSNSRASLMYERAGFSEVGRRPNYYNTAKGREDAIVMAKALII